MASRDLLSRPKAGRMVGGSANLQRLIDKGVITPVQQPNGRQGFVEEELVRWQQNHRVAPVLRKVYTPAELRAMTRGERVPARA